MLYRRALLLTTGLLLLAQTGRAQTRAAPARAAADSLHQQLHISITLPKSVGIIRDCGRILFSGRDSEEKMKALLERRRQKTDKPEVGVSLTLPRNKLTRVLRLVD